MDYRFDIINWRRTQLGWSFETLATETGSSGDTALRACKGENITVRTLRQIAEALHVRYTALVDFTLKRKDFPAVVLPGDRKGNRNGKVRPPSRVAQNTR